jgi:hypothetical protein
MRNKKVTEALTTLSGFIAEHDIEPENVQCLLDAMTKRNLDFTYANLNLVHKELSEGYWQHEAEKAATQPSEPSKFTKREIESWSGAILKQNLKNPTLAREIERALSGR